MTLAGLSGLGNACNWSMLRVEQSEEELAEQWSKESPMLQSALWIMFPMDLVRWCRQEPSMTVVVWLMVHPFYYIGTILNQFRFLAGNSSNVRMLLTGKY